MIELKNVTTEGERRLSDYSLIVRDGEICSLRGEEGRMVVDALLGFLPVEDGYVCFDGMPLTPKSAPFLRKMIAYIPNPEGFEAVEDVAAKQREMVDKALESDASVLLAVNPVSHQDAIVAENIKSRFVAFAQKGRVVVVNE